MQYKAFNVTTINLQGAKLIEASAGTGKTYSIAVLLLRLLIEEKVPLPQVAMITFTKAAVAELEQRVRLFVTTLQQYFKGHPLQDETLQKIAGQGIAIHGYDTCKQLINDAALLLDETAILTIHSFCQQTLSEFAFETQQIFGSELIADTQAVLEAEIDKFWRKHIATLPLPVIQRIEIKTLYKNISTLLRSVISGKVYQPQQYYELKDAADFHKAVNQLQETLSKQIEESRLRYYELFENKKAEIESIINTAKGIRNKEQYHDTLASPDIFAQSFDKLTSARVKEAIRENCQELIEVMYRWQELLSGESLAYKDLIFQYALHEITLAYARFMEYNHNLSFDDIISNLHRAFYYRQDKSRNIPLVNALRKKYKAVFIDEFQDTDKEQYEIFREAFCADDFDAEVVAPCTVFFIGDPKQSIYAFRKADINTYLQAKRDVGTEVYSMNTNYRSSRQMIDALNLFFKPAEDFDTFYYGQEEQRIDYIPVQAPEDSSKESLYFDDNQLPPVSYCTKENSNSVTEAAAHKIAELLSHSQYTIRKKEYTRRVMASDIGVLVATNEEGKNIKAALEHLGVPATIVSDEKVLRSPEAVSVLRLLEAIAEPNTTTVNTVLSEPFTGVSVQNYLHADSTYALELFHSYHHQYLNKGIYATLMQAVSDFDMEHQVILNNSNGERILSNFLQIIELLNDAQNRKQLNLPELIAWFNRARESEISGDEAVLRIESDEDAVCITTIHKSKGLEYNIVIAPSLNFKIKRGFNPTFETYRNPETAQYEIKQAGLLNEQECRWLATQAEQENRRLFYVALTRAVFKLYIINNSRSSKGTTLDTFWQAYVQLKHEALIEETDIDTTLKLRYNKYEERSRSKLLEATDFKLTETNWQKLSYSKLALHEYVPGQKERQPDLADAYDNFIFNHLKSGANTGNLLHAVFEEINFQMPQYWEEQVKRTSSRFLPSANEQLAGNLYRMLQHVMQAPIVFEEEQFALQDIKMRHSFTELEFDFPLNDFYLSQLEKLSTKERPFYIDTTGLQKLQGIMNGKIDFIFRHNKKFYILDWKSNYLGYTTEHYNKESLEAAMTENNYHLQYLIYTLALKKYLGKRMPHFYYDAHFGGVIYMFLRGVRAEEQYGVFTCRPGWQELNKLEKVLGAQKV